MAIGLLVLLVILVPKVDSCDLKSDVGELLNEIEALKFKTAHLDQQVYFKATFQAGAVTAGAGPVVFDKLQENIGNAYSNTTGVFTATNKGLYVFLVQTFTNGGGNANWDVLVNAQMVLRAQSVTQTHTSNEYVYPVILQAGDKVSVYNRIPVNIWGTNHSFFAGWLIKAL